MKAMLLAAGRGERLRPLTDDLPKPLVKANGKALIEYHLENLHKSGINEVVINTCWKGEKLVEYLGNGRRYGVNISYRHESTALETAGGVANALDLLGDHPFLLISADIWCNADLSSLIENAGQQLAHIMLVENPAHHPDGDFSLQGDFVLPKTTNSFTYSGVGIYSPDLFRNLPKGAVPLLTVLMAAMARKQITGKVHDGSWFDIGTTERLAALQKFLRVS